MPNSARLHLRETRQQSFAGYVVEDSSRGRPLQNAVILWQRNASRKQTRLKGPITGTMHVAVVTALLLGAAFCASASQEGVGSSFPKKGTGRLTCILPIKQLRCSVDTRTGFVAGMRYSFGPYGDVNVCSQGNSYQTSWDMSPSSPPGSTTYRQRIDCPSGTPFQPASSPLPTWPGTTRPIDEGYLMPYGSMITQVLVLDAPNPLGEKFGTIAAIAFRYTNQDLVNAASAVNANGDLVCPREPYSWAVCGNLEYAQAYLYPGASSNLPPTGPVTLKATYTSPLSDDGTPSFLGSFMADCSTRGANYLGGDPHESSKFFIKQLKQVCYTRLAHVVPARPKLPPAHRPEVSYDWQVPYEPCYWDKKDSKKSPSVSCAGTGAVVATGKYAALYVDNNGTAWDYQWSADNNGKFTKVEAADVFLGTEPDTEMLSDAEPMDIPVEQIEEIATPETTPEAVTEEIATETPEAATETPQSQ